MNVRVVTTLLVVSICCVTIIGCIASAQDESGIVKEEIGERVDEYLTRITPFGFSGAALVAKDGEIILNKGYGMAIRTDKVPNTSETVFSTGSITKQFTAAAVMKLEMEGLLHTGNPIGAYLENVPEDKAGITLHNLLTHTSGLVQDVGADYEVAHRDETVEKILAQSLDFEPGDRFEYSNINYTLLAAIIEKVSGESYEQFLSEHLFKPAGMYFTGYRSPDWNQRVVAHWYVGQTDNGIPLDKPYPYWNLMGNGGILSTTEDMFKWHTSLIGEIILSAGAKKKLYTPFRNDYAYGWDVLDTPHGTLIQHNGGSMLGNSAEFMRFIDADVVLVLFCNQSYGDRPLSDVVKEKIVDLVFGGTVDIPPSVLEKSPEYVRTFTGDYYLRSGGTILLTVEDTKLVARATDQDAVSVLSGFDDTNRVVVNQLNTLTREIFEAAVKGDFEPFGKILARREERLDRVREFINMRLVKYQDRTGPIRTVRALWTLPSSYENEALETTVQLKGDRGSVSFLSIWKDGLNIGVAPVMSAAEGVSVPVLPVSEYEFAGYNLAVAKSISMRFQKDDSNRIAGLVLPGPTSDVVALKKRHESTVDLSVDELIEKHIEARGGYQALKALQTQKIEQRVSMGPEEMSITIYKKRPHLYRAEQIMPHGDVMVRAVNENSAWIQMGQRSPRERPDFAADHQRESVADFDGILVDYERKGHSIEIVGMEDVEGTETYKLKVGLASGAEQVVYLDAKTYLMKKQVRTAITPQGEIEVIDVYNDYREVDGIMMPFLIHSQQGPQRFDIETVSVEFNVPIDDRIFVMPQKEVHFSNPDELHHYLERRTQTGLFSGVVLIAKDGVPTFHKAYGLASKRFNVPNRTDTKFNIGSINKMFTSVAILQLVEKGKLVLDDPIGTYLPGFPREVSEKVTVRHLLQHRSGWEHYWEDETYLATWIDLRTLDDYMAFIKDTPLDFEPGASQQYSNTGFVVLGAIIEKVSGQSYYEYVREHIFEPAGMKDTDSYEMDDPVENLAIGYTNMSPYGPEEGYQRENIFMHSVKGTSAGGGYSTAEDLLKFDIALRNGRLLGPSYTDLLFHRFEEPEEPRSRSGQLGFAGGAPGINAVLEMNFDTGHTVIVLSNYDPPVAMDLGAEIMEIVKK